MKHLQDRLDSADRKSSNQELRLKNVSAERDQAVDQLAQAFVSTRSLTQENDMLKKENEALRRQLVQINGQFDEETRNWQHEQDTLKKEVRRREKAVEMMREITQEIIETRQDTFANITSRSTTNARRRSGMDANQASRQSRNAASSDARSGPRSRGASDRLPGKAPVDARRRAESRSKSRQRTLHETKQTTTQTDDGERCVDDDHEDNASDEETFDETAATVERTVEQTGPEVQTTEASDYNDILGEGAMAQLRHALAEERAARDERLAALQQDDTVGTTQTGTTAGPPVDESKPSRRGSFKGILKHKNRDELTGRLSLNGDEQNANGQDRTSKSDASYNRRHSENSIHSRTSTRRNFNVEEMTSAFIIPDITLHNTKSSEHPVLSTSARHVLDRLAKHDCHNCTVCTRVASFDDTKTSQTKQILRVNKLIPVSDRMPIPGPYEEEPTMRPAVAPGLALATVMKGLQDELAHLKIQQAHFQALYTQHDASLGKRKRQAYAATIRDLVKAIEKKADQVYALHDVLEGQKESGQIWTEEAVEITLQDCGIDVEALKQGGSPEEEDELDEEGDASDVESELDLPWEGIEDTTGSHKSRRQSWRN